MPHRTRLRTPLFVRPGAPAARLRATSSSEQRLQRPHLRAPHAASRRGSPKPATSATPATNERRPHRQASRLSASSPAAAWRTCPHDSALSASSPAAAWRTFPHDSATGTCKVFQLNQFFLPYFFLASFHPLLDTVLAHRQSSPHQAQLLAPSSFVFFVVVDSSTDLSLAHAAAPTCLVYPTCFPPFCDPSLFPFPKQRTRPRPSARRRLQRGAGGLAPAEQRFLLSRRRFHYSESPTLPFLRAVLVPINKNRSSGKRGRRE